MSKYTNKHSQITEDGCTTQILRFLREKKNEYGDRGGNIDEV